MENNTKILIADENPAQRQALASELRRMGFRNVEEAANGEDALIKIGRFHPDVAILDVWLSKLDGIGVLRNCKSLRFEDDLPPAFIIVSMVSNQSIFMEAGHQDHSSDRRSRPYQGLSISPHGDPTYRPRQRNDQLGDQGTLSLGCQEIQHHHVSRRARHSPCHRGGVGQRRRGYPQFLLWLHHTK